MDLSGIDRGDSSEAYQLKDKLKQKCDLLIHCYVDNGRVDGKGSVILTLASQGGRRLPDH